MKEWKKTNKKGEKNTQHAELSKCTESQTRRNI
jgi:hypothetical protein